MELALVDYNDQKDFKDEGPTLRAGEIGGTYFRSNRLLKINGEYYFSTREGTEIGPFNSKSDAEQGLSRFIHCVQEDQNFERACLAALRTTWAMTRFK